MSVVVMGLNKFCGFLCLKSLHLWKSPEGQSRTEVLGLFFMSHA